MDRSTASFKGPKGLMFGLDSFWEQATVRHVHAKEISYLFRFLYNLAGLHFNSEQLHFCFYVSSVTLSSLGFHVSLTLSRDASRAKSV